jgi:outer membrane protein OmpA-like peptidoglycan-associated protein
MSYSRRSRFSRAVVLASSAMLLLGGPALAQTVSVFDDAPSIEQIRGILIPESHPGLSRSIVIQQPNIASSSAAIQRVSTDMQTTPRAPAAPPKTSPTSIVQANPVMHAPKPDSKPADKAGVVAFDVNFDFNSAALPDSAHEMIDLIAQLMKESPDIKVRVEGHTDAVGSVSYNVSLSERRAVSVGEYLVKQGVDPSRLTLAGKGMAEPLAHNKYDPANRRVQFVRLG